MGIVQKQYFSDRVFVLLVAKSSLRTLSVWLAVSPFKSTASMMPLLCGGSPGAGRSCRAIFSGQNSDHPAVSNC
jgi:hypothetical protein